VKNSQTLRRWVDQHKIEESFQNLEAQFDVFEHEMELDVRETTYKDLDLSYVIYSLFCVCFSSLCVFPILYFMLFLTAISVSNSQKAFFYIFCQRF